MHNLYALTVSLKWQVVLMSATLDSNLFASYFGGCPTLAAGGRTFPVDQVFLEDVYEMIGYRLDPEGPCALRNGTDSAKRKALEKSTGSCQGLVKVGFSVEPALTLCSTLDVNDHLARGKRDCEYWCK